MRRGVLGVRVALVTAVVGLGVSACDDETTTPGPAEPDLSLIYLGSEGCSYCHTEIYADFRKSGHPYKLNKVENGQAPTFPFSAVPDPPAGYTWDDVTYVIGGFGWKARFIGRDGFIITDGGNNQYNLLTKAFSDYHKDERKPYDCGSCHTTGYRPDGNQDGLPGLVGRWAEPGVQCEACHGPGAAHAQNPRTIRVSIDTRSEACGKCHNRGGLNDQIAASGGFIRHHEQYNELQASTMRQLECVTCHDPHTGVRYNDQEGAAAIRADCEDCHTRARPAIVAGALGAKKGDMVCTDCHMPYAAKSAVALSAFVGDVRSHLFTINRDSTAQPFAGGVANHYLTLEFACLPCHATRTKGWAARNAEDVHGPGFASLRGAAPTIPPTAP